MMHDSGSDGDGVEVAPGRLALRLAAGVGLETLHFPWVLSTDKVYKDGYVLIAVKLIWTMGGRECRERIDVWGDDRSWRGKHQPRLIGVFALSRSNPIESLHSGVILRHCSTPPFPKCLPPNYQSIKVNHSFIHITRMQHEKARNQSINPAKKTR